MKRPEPNNAKPDVGEMPIAAIDPDRRSTATRDGGRFRTSRSRGRTQPAINVSLQ